MKLKLPIPALAALAAFALLLSACGGGGSSSTNVGPAGGTVTGADGVSVEVPAEALTTNVNVQIASSTNEAPEVGGLRLLTPIYRITPHGTAFESPVRVKIPFDSNQLKAATAPVILRAEAGSDHWEMLPTDVSDGVAAADSSSFSYFAVGECWISADTIPGPDPIAQCPADFNLRLKLRDQSGVMLPQPRAPSSGALTPALTIDTPTTFTVDVSYSRPAHGEVDTIYLRSTNGQPANLQHTLTVDADADSFVYSITPVTIDPAQITGASQPNGKNVRIWANVSRTFNAFYPGCLCWRPTSWTFRAELMVKVINRGTAPVLTQQPADVTVMAGQTATFTATSDKLGATVRWQRSDDNGATWADVSGASGLSYTTAATTTADSGARFRAIFSNTYGSVTTNAATLTVNPAPAQPLVVTNPSNQSVTVGSTASFAVSVSGTPTPALQWQVSTDGGTAWSDISGATGSTYTTPATTLADSGSMVRVVATNASGSATSTAATLTVTAAPPAGTFGTQQLGVANHPTYGYSVAIDTTGNVYVAGYTEGGLDGNTLTGSKDFFVTKYDSSGTKQYTRQLGASGFETSAQSVATDAAGNVYVAGYTWGGLDGNTLKGSSSDAFVTKYDSNGLKQYTYQLGVSGGSARGNSVTTDAAGNVYVAGDTDGDIASNTLTWASNFFVAKYNSNGALQYVRQLGEGGYETHGNSVVTDSMGNVYVAGYTNASLEGNTLTGWDDLFVTKYDSNGVKQYTRQLGVMDSYTEGYSVATDAAGNVYVAGYTSGGLDGNTLTGIYDFFVTKYNSSGVKQYTRQLGVAGRYTYGNSVATDTAGNVYVAGYTQGDLTTNTSTGANNYFVAKYNSSGVLQYIRQSSSGATYGQSIATDANDNFYVGGYTAASLDGNVKTGIYDFFVTKYDSNGVKQ